MKAFLLARVSTDDQKDALPAQAYRLTEYAKRMGYDYELIEFQESAYKGSRESFRSVISTIESSKTLTAVVFDKIDRYTRDSSSEEVRILQSLYRSGQIELHFPSDNLTIHKDSPATDVMRLGLGVVLAQYYSDAISDNVKRRIEQKLRDGEWIAKAPFGYVNTTLTNGRKWVEQDPVQAQAVKTSFEWYASGIQSLLTIKEKLFDELNISISKSRLNEVLTNPFYYGEMRVKGELYPHRYEPIITKRLFDKSEDVRSGYKVKPHRWGDLPFYYRGLISCHDCGSRITFETKKSKYIYGHCTQFKTKHPMKYVQEHIMTSQLKELFESIQIPEDAYIEVSEALRASYNEKIANRNTEIAALETEIQKYNNRLERVYEDYVDEKIPEPFYQKKFDEFMEAKQKLENRKNTFELSIDEHYGTVSHLLKLSKDAPKLFEKANIEQRRELINLVLSNLQLNGDELLWELKKPFDTMQNCAKDSFWLRRPDSNRQPRS